MFAAEGLWRVPRGSVVMTGLSQGLAPMPRSTQAVWRIRARCYRPRCEQLESRQLLSPLLMNEPLTTDPGVQQMPSIAADPHDPQHLVVAYMDRSLLNTGYAGIAAKVSHDGGATWYQTAVPLPAGFDQGAADP